MSASSPEWPMYLEGADTATFAILHRAEHARRTAVLLCPPFGWEEMCSYRSRREWALHLADAGHTTLRIDLPGSGDSRGAPGEPGQLDSWTQAIEGAARWLRNVEGTQQVAAIGIGLGGMVACRAVAQGAPIEQLVLWSVPARGEVLVRELRAFDRLQPANLDPSRDATVDTAARDDVVVAGGYLLSAETIQDLERHDLTAMAAELRAPRRALVLGADGLTADSALCASLELAGAEVEVADGPGFGAMMVEPQDARAPREVFKLVSAWLDAGEPPPSPRASVARRAARASNGQAAGMSAAPTNEPRTVEELLFRHSGVQLRERPLLLDGPGGRLFGVLTEPLGESRQLTALLLNAGPQRRTGPNRMWVELARRWAAKGVASLRLDADGIGDSDGDTALLAQVTSFYRPRYVEQARAALELLAERGLPARFVTVGLCSGAYWSAQAAIQDDRVAAVIMLNPRTLVFDEWRHAVRRSRRLRERALMTSTWRRLLRGEIHMAKHLETGRTLALQAARIPLRAPGRIAAFGHAHTSAREAGEREPVEELFDTLRERGQRGLLVFTGEEVLRTELTNNGVLDRIDLWPNLQLALIDTAAETHTLTPLWLQRQVHALVDRLLEDELQRS